MRHAHHHCDVPPLINYHSPLPPMPSKARSKQAATIQKKRRRVETEFVDEDHDTSSAEDDVQVLDSDNLDDDSDTVTAKRGKKAGQTRKKNASPTKPRKRKKKAVSDEENDLELKEGQQVVGKIVRAPKSGQGEFQMSHKRERISISLQFHLDRYLRTLSTFWINSRNQSVMTGNG